MRNDLSPVSGRATQIASATIATAAIAFVQIGMAISLAALLFAGELEPALPMAAGSFILGSALSSAFLGWRSSYVGVASGSQDTTAVIVATILAPATAALTGQARLATALLLVAASSALIGVTFYAIGRLQLGSFIRFIPQPVVGGFLAGTGWLLMRGGVDVMLDRTVTLSTVPDLFGWDQLQYVLPGIALGAFMLFAAIRSLPPVSISVGVLATAVIFYIVTFTTSSVEDIEASGWLVGPFRESAQWRPFTPSDLRAADWQTIAQQWPALLTVVLIGVVGLLLNLSALEAVANVDIDLDHELRTSGLANLMIGATGGVAAYHLLGDTVLARQLGVRTRAVPIGVGIVGVIVMIAGSGIVGLVPRAIAGGLLVGLGLSLLWNWWANYLRSATTANRLLGTAILAMIAFVGALEGVGVGVAIAAAMFVFQYARIEPIRYTLTGRLARSRVDRSAQEFEVLDARANAIEVVGLEGYLFFGSATKTSKALRSRIGDESGPSPQYLILDFANVTGMDVSAATSLSQAIGRIDQGSTEVLLAAIDAEIYSRMLRCGLAEITAAVRSVDLAIESCEDDLLVEVAPTTSHTLSDVLDAAIGGQSALLLARCQRVELAIGEHLISEGDIADSLYLIESGSLTAQSGRSGQRIRKVGAGSLLGEVAFAANTVRSADVVADTAIVAYELRRSDFDQLRIDRPDVAADFQGYLVERLADRLADTTNLLNGLVGY